MQRKMERQAINLKQLQLRVVRSKVYKLKVFLRWGWGEINWYTRRYWGRKLGHEFLSSANKVSTGPTCQYLCVCLFVCLFVCLCFYLRCFKSDFDAIKSQSGLLIE